MTTTPTTSRCTRPLVPVALATVVTVVTLVAIWWLAVPRVPVCPAIYPAPPGCTTQHRQEAGVWWSAVMIGGFVCTVLVARTVGRRRRALTGVAVVTLGALGFVAFQAVMFSTGFALM